METHVFEHFRGGGEVTHPCLKGSRYIRLVVDPETNINCVRDAEGYPAILRFQELINQPGWKVYGPKYVSLFDAVGRSVLTGEKFYLEGSNAEFCVKDGHIVHTNDREPIAIGGLLCENMDNPVWYFKG
jgi:hypothetical protein